MVVEEADRCLIQ